MNRHWGIRLGDVVEIKGGGTPSTSNPAFWDGEIPWVSPKDMKSWVISDAQDKITAEAVAGSATNLVPAGSILVVNRSGILKHTLPVGITDRQVAINQDIKALICGSMVDPGYLAHIVKAAEPIVLGWVRATTADNFPVESLRNLEIPFPPLDEQRRIAAILDKADALRQKRKRAITLLDSLTQPIFLEMFGRVEVNDRGWDDSLRLIDISDVGSGITKGRPDKGQMTREVPYMAVMNVQEKHLDLSSTKTIQATDEEIRKFRLRRNDLLLTEGGDPDKLGRGTLWRDELPEAIHQNHIFKVRFHDDRIVPLFANWLIASPRGKRYFLQSAKQTTGIASINKTQLANFPMLLPPLALQEVFKDAAEGVALRLDLAKRALVDVESLFASLQHRAFSGQL